MELSPATIRKQEEVRSILTQERQALRHRDRRGEIRQQKMLEEKRKLRFLECAYEGDLEEMKLILQEVVREASSSGSPRDKEDDHYRELLVQKKLNDLINCCDKNGNSAISEAGSAGRVDVIRFLIENGADPNSRGRLNRTPLYRAAFSGHLDASRFLLLSGGDPRLFADEGYNATDVSSLPELIHLFENWDVSLTDQYIEGYEREKERISKKEEEILNLEAERLTQDCNSIKDSLQRLSVQYSRARANLKDKPEGNVSQLKECDREAIELFKALYTVQETWRDRLKSPLPGLGMIIVTLTDLEAVLTKLGIDDHLSQWPLLIDSTRYAGVFLKYRDTIYIDVRSPEEMTSEKLRLSLLGALRYGRTLCFDMHDIDFYETLEFLFDGIDKNLFDIILTKKIQQPEYYEKLIKEGDPEDYKVWQFQEDKVKLFTLLLITLIPFPNRKLLDSTISLVVVSNNN